MNCFAAEFAANAQRSQDGKEGGAVAGSPTILATCRIKGVQPFPVTIAAKLPVSFLATHTSSGERSPWIERRRESRRGQAPLELAMFLPIFVLLLAAIFAIASAGLAVGESAWEATAKADGGKAAPWTSGSDYTLESLELPHADILERVLDGRPEYDPKAGVVVSTASKDPRGPVDPFPGMLPLAEAMHATAGGSWDNRQIPFPEQAEHPRLTLDRRVAVFMGKRAMPLDGFAKLAAFAGGGGLAAGPGAGGWDRSKLLSSGSIAKVREARSLMADREALQSKAIDTYAPVGSGVPNDDPTLVRMTRELEELQQVGSGLADALRRLGPPVPERAQDAED